MWRFCHLNSNWFRDRKGSEMAKKEIDTTTIGGRIKELRMKAGLSQDELAEKLHLENRASISSYETNRRNVSGALAVDIARVLNSSIDYLLNGSKITDPFIKDILVLAASIKSDVVKKMVLDQLKSAVEMEKNINMQ